MTSGARHTDPPRARQILASIGSSWIFRVVSLLSSIITTGVAAREYGLDGLGLILLAMQVAVYAAMMELGLTTSLTRRLPHFLARGDTREISRLCTTTLLMMCASAALLLLLVPLLSFGLPGMLHLTPAQAGESRALLFVALAFIAMQMPLRLGYGVLASIHRFDVYFGLETAALVFKVAIVVLVLGSWDPPAWVYVLLASSPTFFAAAVQFLLGRGLLPEWGIRLSDFSLRYTKELLSISSASLVGTIAAATTIQGAALILAGLMPPERVAEYVLPMTVAASLLSFAAVSSAIVAPIASQLRDSDPAQLGSVLVLSARYSVAVAGATAVLAFIAGPAALELWLGGGTASPAELDRMAVILAVATASGAVAVSGTTYRGALASLGKHWVLARTELAASLVGLCLGTALMVAGTDGPLAMAVGFGLIAPVRAVLLQRLLARTIGLSILSTLVRSILPSALPIAAALTVAMLVRLPLSSGSLVSTIASALAAAVIYLIASYFLVLTANHRLQLTRWPRRDADRRP